MSDQQKGKNGQFLPAMMEDPSVTTSMAEKGVVSCEEELGVVEGHVVAAVVRTVVASVWASVETVGSGVVMTVGSGDSSVVVVT